MSELLPIDEQPTMVTGPMDFYTPDPPEDGLAPVPVPVPVAAAQPPAATETITCPECGTIATVTLNRRDSSDFCRNCDYPLFWTPSRVLTDANALQPILVVDVAARQGELVAGFETTHGRCLTSPVRGARRPA